MFEKRFVKRLVLCLLCVALCFAFCSCGNSTKKGTEGLEYEANDGSYIVTGYHGTEVHVVIPDTHNGIPVTEIANYAFEESEIQSVKIGNNVKAIGQGAFYEATLLKEVYISASVEKIGGEVNVYAATGVFDDCISLEKVTIEKGSALWLVGSHTFKDCTALKEVTLPDSVQKIDAYAFARCMSLSKLEIPASVTYVGVRAFDSFGANQEIVIKGSTSSWQSTIYGGNWDAGCNAKIIYE